MKTDFVFCYRLEDGAYSLQGFLSFTCLFEDNHDLCGALGTAQAKAKQQAADQLINSGIMPKSHRSTFLKNCKFTVFNSIWSKTSECNYGLDGLG